VQKMLNGAVSLFIAIASFAGGRGAVCWSYHEIPLALAPGQSARSTATQAADYPAVTLLRRDEVSTSASGSQNGNFDCSSGAIVSEQEPPFYSPEARLRACIVPESGYEPK
jgi:hypothetical protein